MTLNQLIIMTRVYCRDDNSFVFLKDDIIMFINQGIDRIKQYKVFSDMPHLVNDNDEVSYLPPHYQYLLALFAASRCFEKDERFYEGIEKRNEFENDLSGLINELESGNIDIYDSDGELVDIESSRPCYVEYVTDAYFRPKPKPILDDGGE